MNVTVNKEIASLIKGYVPTIVRVIAV